MIDSGRFDDLDTAYVYVIATKCDDGSFTYPVKVGYSKNPRSRICPIKTACPFPVSMFFWIELPAELARILESGFHEMHSDKNLHNEWFKISPMEAAQRVCLAVSTFLCAEGADTDFIFEYISKTTHCLDDAFAKVYCHG